MIKITRVTVQASFWLEAFAAPILICGIIAFIIYSNNESNKFIAIVVLIAGIISAIALAEFIRRKYGLDNFFSKIYGSGELDNDISKDK
jgi:EamA domain-containing membrane protein RarD